MAKKTEAKAPETEAKAQVSILGVTDDAGIIAKGQAEIAAATTSIGRKIAINSASCIVHAIVHSNITPCLNLIATLNGEGNKGKTMFRVNALRQWFIDKGPMKVVEHVDADGKKTNVLAFDPAKHAKLAKLYETDAKLVKRDLMAIPFWEAKAEAPFKGGDFNKELAQFLAKWDRHSKNNKLSDEDKAKLSFGAFYKVRGAILGAMEETVH